MPCNSSARLNAAKTIAIACRCVAALRPSRVALYPLLNMSLLELSDEPPAAVPAKIVQQSDSGALMTLADRAIFKPALAILDIL